MTIKEYIKVRKEEIKNEVSKLEKRPFLVVIQVNEDAGSNAYVKGKLKDCDELGIKAELIKLPIDTSEENLLKIRNFYFYHKRKNLMRKANPPAERGRACGN